MTILQKYKGQLDLFLQGFNRSNKYLALESTFFLKLKNNKTVQIWQEYWYISSLSGIIQLHFCPLFVSPLPTPPTIFYPFPISAPTIILWYSHSLPFLVFTLSTLPTLFFCFELTHPSLFPFVSSSFFY